MENINLLEAIYILNINNYFQEIENFVKYFINLENNKKQILNVNEINDNVKFFQNVEIKNLNKFNNSERNSKLKIKGIGSGLIIGKNNDRSHFPQFVEKVNEYLLKRFSKK